MLFNKRAIIFSVLILFAVMIDSVSADDKPYIVKWYDNHKAAVSLRFDDAHESHVNIAVPLLNEYGFQATFMVNPERQHYMKYKQFWEKDLPLMGHRLGNHTMNHRGANNLEEAEYEIGEASKIIWDLYPQESELLVFASGGGEKWGGKFWKNASNEYKDIVKKYNMIDLYDGAHPAVGAGAAISSEQLCSQIDRAIRDKEHQAFVFHNIGEKDFIEKIKTYLRGRDISFDQEKFNGFLQCIAKVRDQVWVAPLIQILKYEEEYKNAQIRTVDKSDNFVKMELIVKTDPTLYDQKLTVLIKGNGLLDMKAIYQNSEQINDINKVVGGALVNVMPFDSEIVIHYLNKVGNSIN